MVTSVCPKGGQGVALWQRRGETEIGWVSWYAHVHMEKGFYDLGRDRDGKRRVGYEPGTSICIIAFGLHVT